MIMLDEAPVSIRKLGFAELEDYRDHLLRLDSSERAQFFSRETDDHAILAHCLGLILGETVIMAVLERGAVRGACAIRFDRSNQSAELALSFEFRWRRASLERRLIQESLITCFGAGTRYVVTEVDSAGEAAQELTNSFGFVSVDAGDRMVFSKKLTDLGPVIAAA